ncbi:MAG: PepSY domain-containing protein [Alphaproteobacteria bacterium]
MLLAGLLATAATPALADRRGVPGEVGRALAAHPKYRGARIRKVNLRRGARTADGTLYEVEVETPDRRRYLVYVDPNSGRVLYDTGPLR